MTHTQNSNEKLQKRSTTNSINKIESTDLAEIKAHGTQLSTIKNQSPELAIAEIVKSITSIQRLIRVDPSRVLSGPDTVRIAKMILKKYWYLKIEEIDLALEDGIMNNDKTYGKFDAETVFGWLHQYDISEKHSDVAIKNAQKFKELESSGHNPSILEAPQFREKLKALMDAPTENEILNIAKPVPTKDIVKGPTEPKTIEGYQTVDVQKYSNELTKIIKAGGQLTKEQSRWIKDMNGTVVAGLGIQYKL